MKKVVHILNSASYSGAENVVITIIKSMKEEQDNNYDFLYLSRQGDIQSFLDVNNIKYYLLSNFSLKSIKTIIKQIKPDIIHAHDFTASIISAFLFPNIPIISHIHNNPPWIQKICLKSVLYAITLPRYKKILTVSDAVVNEYVFNKLMKDKTLVLGNPVDTSLVNNKANESSQSNIYDIVFLGRLAPQKNPLRLIDIVYQVKKTIPNIRCACIGKGPLYNECRKKILELDLQNNIELLGFMENPYKILKNSKLLCIPSDWEGYGMVAVEALSLGVPVVSSGVGGLKDIVTKESGKICDKDEEFVKEIIELVHNREYQEKKAINALIRANELNNIYEYCSVLNDIYINI